MLKDRAYNLITKILLILLLIWGAASFFVFEDQLLILILVGVFSAVSVYFIIANRANFFLLTYLAFANFYAGYGLLYNYNIPLSLVMILLALVLAILFWILAGKVWLQILSFVIALSEIFLALSYFLISPLTRSAILLIFVYLFYGYFLSAEPEKFDLSNFKRYLLVAFLLLLLIFTTVSWGR
ncbi:MAG: hypothetical protein NTW79_03000 [Candidatus Berkelbacteria bacterium]|nr:hypothetical protein [Candidatus Berkelbacteria bacterium]